MAAVKKHRWLNLSHFGLNMRWLEVFIAAKVSCELAKRVIKVWNAAVRAVLSGWIFIWTVLE